MPNDPQAARVEDRKHGPVAAPGVVLGGKYRLEEAIARGGMARVWRARHIDLNRPVAVKFVDGAGAGPSGIERFMIEAKVAASIRHKNVVDILDFGFVEQPDGDPEPYMVMELLEGETLGDRIGRSPLSDGECVDIALQLLNGLDAVHRAGIIHRDLKPGNLFLTHDHDGTFARLLDFGISEGAEERATMMEAGQVVGTPEYMSPEQAFGAAVDLRADLYGVGVMLYEMLSGGRLPFEHEEAHRVLEMVAAGAHTSLLELRPEQPELAAVVERALARNPEDRYANAREMRRAIIDATGTGDTTTERMAAIRESGTRRRPQITTAPELAAPLLPSLPAGSPLLVVPVPASAAPRSQMGAAIIIGALLSLAAVASGVWAMTRDASDEAPATPGETEATSDEATSDEAMLGAAVVEEAVVEEAAVDDSVIDDSVIDDSVIDDSVIDGASADDEAIGESDPVAEGSSDPVAEGSSDPVAEGSSDPVAEGSSAPSEEPVVGPTDAASARRPRRARGAAPPTTASESVPSAPPDPPRAVVRDLDF